MNELNGQSEAISESEMADILAVCQYELIPYATFVDPRYDAGWVHKVIAKKLEAVERGDIKRLILCVPPRIGKSRLATQLFPSLYLGRHPEKEIIVSSYASDLAVDFGYKTRELMNSQEYHEVFPGISLRDDSQAKAKWLTEQGGGYTSVGVGGSIVGRGAHLFVIDDPHKNRKEAESKLMRDNLWNWFTSTAYTRLEKDAAIVVIMQRWHTDDLVGRLLEKEKEGGDHWEVVDFPAIAEQDEEYRKAGEPIWPEKYPLEKMMETKKMVGLYDWASMYQQKPIIAENQLFKPEYFKKRPWDEVQKLDTRRFLTIDTAVSQSEDADYCGFTINFVDSENNWNFKAWRERLTPLALIDKIFDLWELYRLEEVGVEKTMFLQTIKPFLDEEMRKRNKFPRVIELLHKQTNKELRIRNALLPRYEAGSVYHIEGQCDDLELEAVAFPFGANDDTIDSAAYQSQIAKRPMGSSFQRVKQLQQPKLPSYE